MTKSDVMKEFLKKTVIPVVVALFLFSMFSRIFIENGAPDYFLIWLACGVPFGIGKMFTLIPIGFGISGTVGVVALNLALGGLIGGAVVGAAGRMVGTDLFTLFFGQAPTQVTGALEGAIGFFYKLGMGEAFEGNGFLTGIAYRVLSITVAGIGAIYYLTSRQEIDQALAEEEK